MLGYMQSGYQTSLVQSILGIILMKITAGAWTFSNRCVRFTGTDMYTSDTQLAFEFTNNVELASESPTTFSAFDRIRPCGGGRFDSERFSEDTHR